MRNLIINKCLKIITKKNHYDDQKLKEIKYGLEALYITISRTLIFLIINILLGTLKEFLLFFFIYIPLRSFSFGFHAKTSSICWIISSISFIGIPLISTLISINFYLKVFLSLVFLIIFYLYSPADTHKRPIVNRNLRRKLKFSSIILILFYNTIFLIFDSNVTNIIILSLLYQSIIISPPIYKIFHASYNNYLRYGLN